MATERKMVRVCVYEDGTWDIYPLKESNIATTRLFCSKPGTTNINGLCCICKEDMRYVYLKRLIKEMQSIILAKIGTMQIASSNLQKIWIEADTKEMRRQKHVRDDRPLEEVYDE